MQILGFFMEKILKLLNFGISKHNAMLIAEQVSQDNEKYDKLINIVFDNIEPISRRAVYAIDNTNDINPKLITKYIDRITDFVLTKPNYSIMRSFLKLLSNNSIRKEKQGEMLQLCTDYIYSEKVPPAVKVHCLQIFYNISEEEKDLKIELKQIIESTVEFNSAAYKSKAGKLLKSLSNK